MHCRIISKTQDELFLKNQKICLTVNRLSGILINKTTRRQGSEAVTLPVLHLLL